MGHLFVAQGDLTRFACDALVIPCDKGLNVNKAWERILPDALPIGDREDWRRIDGIEDSNGVVAQPDSDGRLVRAFVAVEFFTTPEEIVGRLWRALRKVSEDLTPPDFRVKPLIAMPLVGTGYGGLEGHRAEVISSLLDRYRSEPLSVDLALILIDRRDFAAVQNQRQAAVDWIELDEELRLRADELGRLAGRQELSLFLGSGVSRPVGLPDWRQLLDSLAAAVPMHTPSTHNGFEEAATPIKAALGERYYGEMVSRLTTDQHAIGHALLAGLRVKQMVTTNFDRCMELALEALLDQGFRVLARELTVGGMAWLLKLHGDILQPESLIFTSQDVERHALEAAPLRGVVQSLLLTSHLLFVGFSFKDNDFLELATAVSRVRAAAEGAPGTTVGTALALTEEDADSVDYDELSIIAMPDNDRDEAARKLEIFLDRLAWSAATSHELSAEYLLDDRYENGLPDADLALRKVLKDIAKEAREARGSAGWPRVAACLRELGADSEDL